MEQLILFDTIEAPKKRVFYKDAKGRFANRLVSRAELAERQLNGLKSTIKYLTNIIDNQQKQLRIKDEVLTGNKTDLYCYNIC